MYPLAHWLARVLPMDSPSDFQWNSLHKIDEEDDDDGLN